MAALSMMDHVAIGSMGAGVLITLLNKAFADGARNMAARLAWALIGTAIAIYVYGAMGGMLYSLDEGVVVASSSRGGSASFHRDEHPLLFWITFFALTLGMAVHAGFSALCFWKAFKRG